MSAETDKAAERTGRENTKRQRLEEDHDVNCRCFNVSIYCVNAWRCGNHASGLPNKAPRSLAASSSCVRGQVTEQGPLVVASQEDA